MEQCIILTLFGLYIKLYMYANYMCDDKSRMFVKACTDLELGLKLISTDLFSFSLAWVVIWCYWFICSMYLFWISKLVSQKLNMLCTWLILRKIINPMKPIQPNTKQCTNPKNQNWNSSCKCWKKRLQNKVICWCVLPYILK